MIGNQPDQDLMADRLTDGFRAAGDLGVRQPWKIKKFPVFLKLVFFFSSLPVRLLNFRVWIA
jgi:hypothetical protein